MEKRMLTCIGCPLGCSLTAVPTADGFDITGYTCKRGLEYASAEFAHPVRILTTIVKLEGQNDLLPVRSNKPVPKEKLVDGMDVIRATAVKAPVNRYDVVVADICGTGVNMVATKDMA